jgi:hypothetical protein
MAVSFAVSPLTMAMAAGEIAILVSVVGVIVVSFFPLQPNSSMENKPMLKQARR